MFKNIKINFFQLAAIAAQIQEVIGGLSAGQPESFKTYVAGKHVQVTVQEIA
jgi:hypothetical protein